MKGKWLGIAALTGFMVSLLAASWTLAAEEDEAATPPLQYRKVYAPADRMADWPLPQVPHVPVDAEEFERLVDLARASQSGAPVAVGARLVETSYEARLDGDELTLGSARLHIEHEGTGTTILPLAPFSLAVSDARWEGDAAQPAVLGLQPSGELGVLVQQSGTLRLAWSLRGKRDATQALSFDLQLPDCSIKRLQLDLPAELVPHSDQGVLVSVAEAGQGRRHWQIDLGGSPALGLRIRAESASAHQRRLTLLRQALSYDFSPRGVEVSAQLTLDVHHEPLRSFAVRLDPSLRLVSARYGEADVLWSESPNEATGQVDVELQLPEAIQGTSRVVRLVALAPLEMDRSWKLPTIEPQGMFWSEGSIRLLVPAPLAVNELTLHNCRQTKVEPLPEPQSGELLTVQQFAPEAAVNVVVGWQTGNVELRQGTTLNVGAGELSGRMVANFTVDTGEHYALSADVPAQWIIDTVDSVPSGQLSDWTVEPIDGRRLLNVRLAQALTAKRPLQLIITGRSRRSALERPLTAGECRMLDFLSVNKQRDLMLLRSVPPYQLQITGEEKLSRLDAAALSLADLGLLEQQWEGLAFEYGTQGDALRVSLQQQRANYSGTVEVHATVLPDALSEAYSIRCIPDSPRVERVLVHFSQARDYAPRWVLVGESEPQLTATRLDAAQQAAAGLGAEGETWEIVLRRPRSVPFELQTVRTTPLTDETPISLAALPEAVTHGGTLTVAAVSEASLTIDNHRLDPIPTEPAGMDQYSLARASYHYEPARDVIAASEPAILVSPEHQAATPRAWVWSAQLDSRYAPNGITTHLATYQMQNAGCRQVQVTLPAEARLQAVWIDDSRVPHGITTGAGNELLVDLPAGEKFPVLTVHFDMQDEPLGFVQSRTARLPEIDLPILSSQWTLWLPAGYRIRGGEALLVPRLHWSERLFGPLGRGAERAPFDPLGAEDWVSLVRESLAETNEQQLALKFLDHLGLMLRESEGTDLVTWGDLLPQAAIDLADQYRLRGADVRGLPRLMVDRQALAQSGLTSRHALRERVRGPERLRSISALEQANLAVLVHDRLLIVTTDVTAALYREQLLALDQGPLYLVLPGPLKKGLDAHMRIPNSGPLLSALRWAGGASDPVAPWTPSWQHAADLGGWSAYRVAQPLAGSAMVRIVRGGALLMLGWGIFLLLATLTYWKWAGSPRIYLPVLGASGAAALLLPDDFVPVATGVFLGIVLGLVASLLRKRQPREGQEEDPSRRTDFVINPHALTSLLLTVMVALVGVPASAQEAPDAAPPVTPPAQVIAAPAAAAPAVHHVFIPIDENRQPTGGKYHVPETFFQKLNRLAGKVSQQPRGWFLAGATYRGSLSLQADLNRLAVDQFRAIYDVHVFARGRTVRIPLLASEVTVLPEGSKLDGRSIPVRWDEQQKALEFTVDEPGQYRLSLTLGPVIKTTDSISGFDLAIPPLPNSRLELTLPTDGPEVQVPSAMGAMQFDRTQGRLTADLGTAPRLTVRWPVGTGSGTGGGDTELEQLVWLKIQPGAVTLEARWKATVVSGRVRQLKIKADARLRLLPFAEDSIVSKVTTEAGPLQTITLDLKRPLSDQTVLDARLLMTGVSGVGNLRLPVIEIDGPKLAKRLLAVSVDSALEHEETAIEGMQAITVPDFAASWGDARAKPAFAYQLLERDATWSLATRPPQPQVETEETLFLSIARQEAEVFYEAQLETNSGYQFQHRLTVPTAMLIENVSVHEEAGERTVRWARNADNRVTIFLSGPVTGAHQLRLHGRLPIALNGQLHFPELRLETAHRRERRIHIFRRSDALVRVEPDEQLVAVGDPYPALPAAEMGRLVGSYKLGGPATKSRLHVSANNVVATATTVTSLERGTDDWQAVFECRGNVQRGVMDRLQLVIPAWWTGPFEVTPEAEVTLVQLSGQSQQQLVIRPQSALAGDYRLRLQAAVPMAQGDRPRVPEIIPVGMQRAEHYLVLPTQSDLQQIAWETRGLSRAELPPGFLQPLLAQETFETFQVVGEHFQAIPNSVGRAIRIPQIRLADIGVAWNHDKTYDGVAIFDLEPAGLNHCVLQLPERAKLLQATVAGLPAMLQRLSQTQYRLTLGPSQLPQRIEIVYSGQTAPHEVHSQVELASPLLISRHREVPIERTLWTVYGPADAGTGLPLRGSSTHAAGHERIRLRNIASLLDLDSEVAASLPAEQLAHWYRPWAIRLLRSRMAVFREASIGEGSESSSEEMVEARSLVRDHDAIARRLGMTEVLAQLSGQTGTFFESGDLWPWAFQSQPEPTRAMYLGAAPTLRLTYASATASDLPWRFAGALLIALTAGSLLVAIQRGVWVDAARRWPHAVGVAAGIFYWLFLSPSLLGWGIIAVSLFTALRPPWRNAVPLYEESTVIRREPNSTAR